MKWLSISAVIAVDRLRELRPLPVTVHPAVLRRRGPLDRRHRRPPVRRGAGDLESRGGARALGRARGAPAGRPRPPRRRGPGARLHLVAGPLVPRASPTDRQPLAKIMDAVQRALDESRGAIAALNRPIDEPLDLALEHAGHRRRRPGWRPPPARPRRQGRGDAGLAGCAPAHHPRGGRQRGAPRARPNHHPRVEERGSRVLRITDDGQGFDVVGSPIGPELRPDRACASGPSRSAAPSPSPRRRPVGTTIEVTLP